VLRSITDSVLACLTETATVVTGPRMQNKKSPAIVIGMLACLAALALSYGVGALAKEKIGGQTGDVAGAAQQLSEIAYYLAFAAGV